MQIKVLAPKNIRGRVVLPSSKSISNRVLVINALAGNRCKLPANVSDCDDTRVMIDWMSSQSDVVDIGAAGTAMRFSTALLSVTEGERTITGTKRMRNRPISVLVDALRTLGAEIEYLETEGYPPLLIKGRTDIEGGEISLPGTVSSQYISALLMIAPVLRNGLRLKLTGGVISRPYINLTMSLMREFGAEVMWTDTDSIVVKHKPYSSREYYVESDWSASSYWYEMVALADDGEVVLPSLFRNSGQGDSKVAVFFERLGVGTEFLVDEETGMEFVRLRKTGHRTERLDLNFVDQPDLAQTFVVCCCMLGVPFRFTGLQSLKIKETDRIVALQRELLKLGYVVGDEDDSVLYWEGEVVEPQSAPVIDTYEDHRMAMAFAPCVLRLGEITINEPQVVTKSYPKYWEDLKSVGFHVE